jgi:hypothetical protein
LIGAKLKSYKVHLQCNLAASCVVRFYLVVPSKSGGGSEAEVSGGGRSSFGELRICLLNKRKDHGVKKSSNLVEIRNGESARLYRYTKILCAAASLTHMIGGTAVAMATVQEGVPAVLAAGTGRENGRWRRQW